jgi:hypothetical protein
VIDVRVEYIALQDEAREPAFASNFAKPAIFKAVEALVI